MEDKYDSRKKRYVEAWNTIYFDTEEPINLSCQEYDELGFDFTMNEMFDCAFRTYHRGIEAGHKELIPILGALYEQTGNLEYAYRCYLEAALINNQNGLKNLSRMYKKGIYVQKDEKKAKKLNMLSKKTIMKKKR
ncbi:hypothetical protein [Faecalicoccus pleomorphus]|uniref:hypothetical protein n=1 Tax=Faecalicoccus pleomorphus TaxID=1323 RepID=UPI001961F68A|nr:hypothetical protein [Faecalicoccus pleomorphus]MBM6809230.1 hypothetical protein [Faecalicoccus pleomorphus]